MKNFNGKTLFLDRVDINTDEIIPARYLTEVSKEALKPYLFENFKLDGFNPRTDISDKNIIITRANFGCGSSREHAPLALKAAGVSCIVARTFARIFYRNSLNLGLPLLESPEASEGIKDGDRVRVNLNTGEIFDLTQNRKFHAKPIPAFMQDLLRDGGLISHLRKEKSKRK